MLFSYVNLLFNLCIWTIYLIICINEYFMNQNTIVRSTRSNSGQLLSGLQTDRKKYTRVAEKNNQRLEKSCVKMSDAEVIAQLTAEIAQLRELNKTQNAQITRMRNQIETESNDSGNQLIKALLAGFRAMSVEVKVPKFDEKENANHFLERVEKFFVLKQIQNDAKLNILDSTFEGRAKVWFESERSKFTDYDDFRVKFLNEFFSVPIRVRIKSAWMSRRFGSGDSNLQTYFSNQLKEAQHFIPTIEPYELHYIIIQQMPIV